MSHQDKIKALMASIDVKGYGKSRNYVNGSVTELGPYVSRGVISTRMIWEFLLDKGYSFEQMFGFVQQLAWRDFFQRVWMGLGDGINAYIRGAQQGVKHSALPAAIAAGSAGIEGIDVGIHRLLSTGYLHNHQRMYTAFITCNLAGAHWKLPAQWMYAHLLDGDWGSNALSWQWVAGTFSNKKYIANQENINRYTHTHQRGTYLDVEYEQLAEAPVPSVLKPTLVAEEVLPFSDCDTAAWHKAIEKQGLCLWDPQSALIENRVVLHNYYQLSPSFAADTTATRVLLIEPSVFAQYTIAAHCVDFMLSLAAEIPHLQVFVGEFGELQALLQAFGSVEIGYQEHPLNQHYTGTEIARDWLSPEIEGTFSSFFSYWKKVEKSLRKEYKEVNGF
ncbi:MAG: FAD-binding domain-containing protein [Bacteroidota bacterium]